MDRIQPSFERIFTPCDYELEFEFDIGDEVMLTRDTVDIPIGTIVTVTGYGDRDGVIIVEAEIEGEAISNFVYEQNCSLVISRREQ